MCALTMAGVAAPIRLTEEERTELESWVRKGTTEQRLVQRARIVLECAAGKTMQEVDRLLQACHARVRKWRNRFARQRLGGLEDSA